MECPRCGRTGRKLYKGYCTRVHMELEAPPKFYHLDCAGCGARVVRTPSRKRHKVYCIRCKKNKGENHPRWRDGQYINNSGYRLVLHKNEYKLEHRVTWEQGNNACLLPGAGGIIHHIDFDKLNNSPSNLVLLTSRDHGRIHRLIDAERYNEAKCQLITFLEQQAFFLLHSEHLERIRRLSLPDILN